MSIELFAAIFNQHGGDFMSKEEMIKLLQEKFSDIWDCEIDHRKFQNTVGELLTEAVEIITDQS